MSKTMLTTVVLVVDKVESKLASSHEILIFPTSSGLLGYRSIHRTSHSEIRRLLPNLNMRSNVKGNKSPFDGDINYHAIANGEFIQVQMILTALLLQDR